MKVGGGATELTRKTWPVQYSADALSQFKTAIPGLLSANNSSGWSHSSRGSLLHFMHPANRIKPLSLKDYREKQALAVSHISILGPTQVVASLQNSPCLQRIPKCPGHGLGKAFVGLQLPHEGLLPKTLSTPHNSVWRGAGIILKSSYLITVRGLRSKGFFFKKTIYLQYSKVNHGSHPLLGFDNP